MRPAQPGGVRPGFGFTRLVAIWLLLVLVGAPQGATAQDSLREQLHQLGIRACDQVWQGGGLGGVDFAAQATAAGLQKGAYCTCVGTLFEGQTGGPGDQDPEAFMAQLITATMKTCLSESAGDDAVEDGDLIEELPFELADVQQCEAVLEGALALPGLSIEKLKQDMQRSGQPRDDLCVCAARFFTAGGQPLRSQLQQAADAKAEYANAMAHAVAMCRLE